MVKDGKQGGQLQEYRALSCGGVTLAYGAGLSLHLIHGEVLVKQTAPVGVFGMLMPQVLEHVTWINLPPAQTTPCAKGCAKSVILNELCKEASGKFAVQVRKGE